MFGTCAFLMFTNGVTFTLKPMLKLLKLDLIQVVTSIDSIQDAHILMDT